jgi:RimJ/RimL family protein N-acetyltransferase
VCNNFYSFTGANLLSNRDFWGQGLATEAAIACRDWAFAHLETDRLISLIRHGNTRSRRVAERTGMTVWKEVN